MQTRSHAADHAAHAEKSAPKALQAHAMEDSAGATARIMPHDMAHEMGHGAGMDMQGMVRDMRNRFWIASSSPCRSLSIRRWADVHSARASLRPDLTCGCSSWRAPPSSIRSGRFGRRLRALRNGVLDMAVLVVLSVGAGYLFSVGATFFFKGEQFYEAAAVLAGLHSARPLAGDAGTGGGFGGHPGVARSGPADGHCAPRRP